MIQFNENESKNAMMDLAQKLFPIHRTLVNKGYARSLEIIRETLDIDILEYPSGSKVWDWCIPNAWDVNEAFIADSKGNKLVDFKDNNLHLSAYSKPFSGVVSRDELFKHINTIEKLPDSIPYNYLYYNQNNWVFNVAFNTLDRFTDSSYQVHIDVSEKPDYLRAGSYSIRGQSNKEFIITTYLCHPSLANDNLSGVLVATELFKLLSRNKNFRYSYRLLIVPETIGSITWLANHEDLLENILGGYTVYDCGDKGSINYKRSYNGNAMVDRVAAHVLKHHCPDSQIQDFTSSGSDERQFNAPGVRIPVGAFMRTPPGFFKEYHTSKDNLSVLSPDGLFNSVYTLLQFIEILEKNAIYKNEYRGEPFFSKYPIKYPFFPPGEDPAPFLRNLTKILTHEIDGKNDLLSIAEKWDLPFESVYDTARQFVENGLATEMTENLF